ncbi:MAG: DNA repair protein RecO [Arenicellales bacterium]|nr:DNA repair protein RecO [Arenicellales bacterium]
MTAVRVKGQPGFLLHRRPYSETSLLVDLFSREHGRITVIAKGARQKKSQVRGVLRPFGLITLGWSGKGEVKTLTQCESPGPAFNLRRRRLLCGYYLNELLLKFLHRYDPHETLFDYYQAAVMQLAQGVDNEAVLRVFEKQLMNEAGYGLQLDRDHDSGEAVKADKMYRYLPGVSAFIDKPGRNEGVLVHGSSMIALRTETGFDERVRLELKQLNRSVLRVLLEGRPLLSRTVYLRLYPASSRPSPDL